MPIFPFLSIIAAEDHESAAYAHSEIMRLAKEFTGKTTITVCDISKTPDQDDDVRDLAKAEHHKDGECEIDDNGVVSYSDDNGAYVQAWIWVDFAGTDLDRDNDPDDLVVD